MQLLATPFTGLQLALIIIVSLICVLLFAGNAALIFLFFHKRKRGKMCNAELQRRRDELLEELVALRSFVPAARIEDEEADGDEDDEEEDEDVLAEEGDEEEGEDESEPAVVGPAFNAEILAVRDMSDKMREKFGFLGEEYRRKRYFVRISYGFEAKLLNSSDDIKLRYKRIINEFCAYARVNSKTSFRKHRIYIGRKTIAVLLFKGKKLCVAFALDPAEYENTKYRVEDVSDKKSYAGTPALVRVTSDRRLEYVIQLISQLAEKNGVTAATNRTEQNPDLKKKSRNDLFSDGKIKISILGEADELDDWEDEEETAEEPSVRAGILAVSDMSPLMRERFALVGSEFDEKKFYVRYGYSFEAKLRTAKDEIKERYIAFANETLLYKKLKLGSSFRNQRLSYGRKTVGLIFFRGKTLCVAFALNPKAYENTRFKGEDFSDKKQFSAVPMVLRLTSARRLSYAKYLLTQIAEEKAIEMNASPETKEYDLGNMARNELFEENLIKINIIGEVPEGKKKS